MPSYNRETTVYLDAGSRPGGGPGPSVSLRPETGSIELRRLRDLEPAAASL